MREIEIEREKPRLREKLRLREGETEIKIFHSGLGFAPSTPTPAKYSFG